MKSQDQDWLVLNSATHELQEYLLSAEVFWPITATSSAAKTSLTPGMILLGLKRMKASNLPSERREELTLLASRVLEIRKRWEANWVKKAQKEYSLRTQLWKNYLSDIVSDPFEHAPFFPQQVHMRVILQLLYQDVENQDQKAEDILFILDDELRSISTPGPFVWESEIENGFSSQEYWFLYLSLNKSKITS